MSADTISWDEAAARLQNAPFAWVEITDIANKQPEGQWALGSRLWSPSQYTNGADRYSLMRDIRSGDLVLHFVKMTYDGVSDRYLAGLSEARGEYQAEEREPSKPGSWSERESYLLVDLQNYRALTPPLLIKDLIAAYDQEIDRLRTTHVGQRFPFAQRTDGVQLVKLDQSYITKAPRDLIVLIADALIAIEKGGALPQSQTSVPAISTNIWARAQPDDPAELRDILEMKVNLPLRSTVYVRPLQQWYNRHKHLIGDGEPQLLILGPGAWRARIGSVQPDHKRMFWLPKDLDPDAIAQYLRASFEDRPQLKTVLFFSQDTAGSFSVEAWGTRGNDPLIDMLRASGVKFKGDRYVPPASTPSEASPENTASTPISERTKSNSEPPASIDVRWADLEVQKVLDASGLRGAREAVVQAVAALRAGSNVIFVGAPGSGKTTLAEAIFEVAGVPCDVRCASDHWTTFETIGGYFPEPTEHGSKLVFRPGVVLSSIQNGHCLIIDEINRADIDKAFGELFTIFGSKSAAAIRLPLQIEDSDGFRRSIAIAKANPLTGEMPVIRDDECAIMVPPSWRMIGSMNDADRASLKRFSLAFARRFAMVPVPLPEQNDYEGLIRDHVSQKVLPGPDALQRAAIDRAATDYVQAFFAKPTGLFSIGAPLGPGFAKAVIDQIYEELGADPERTTDRAFLSAIELYVAPQFQGIATKHQELIDVVRSSVPGLRSDDLARLDAALSGWTGGAVAA